MRWSRWSDVNTTTCGEFVIERDPFARDPKRTYFLQYRGSTIDAFETLKDAKQHARGMAYVSGEKRGRGRPASPGRCTDCGASPANQRR